MSYEVSIVADSVAPHGGRITTFQLKYPRMVHAELMTHRMFSRNASSTRAIPTAKMIEWIERDPAMPVYWGKNQKGMQATDELTEAQKELARAEWLDARDFAINRARELMEIGVHKQIASRILEPWAHINVVVTATNWANFFALRCHEDAMPEIQALAVRMARAYRDSTPRPTGEGRWHLPYVTEDEMGTCRDDQLLKFATARCARVSYLTFDGKQPDPEADVKLHDMLLGNGHWSPFEHAARAAIDPDHVSGNFRGWHQYRQRLPKSVHATFDLSILDRHYADRDFIV